jgi:hypothetical protein
MALVTPNPLLEFHITGGQLGASNTNPFFSLGGQMAALIANDKLDNLWDPVSSTQQEAGSTEYRWIVLYNKTTQTMKNPHFYFLPKDPNVDIEFSRLAVSAPVSILAHEDDRPDELEIGPEQDVPMPFTKSTEDFFTTQSVGPDIPSQGKLYICIRRVIDKEALSENRAYVLVAESRIPSAASTVGG